MSTLHSGFAACAAEPSVILPVGLQVVTLAQDIDFGRCMISFGLDWGKAKAQVCSASAIV